MWVYIMADWNSAFKHLFTTFISPKMMNVTVSFLEPNSVHMCGYVASFTLCSELGQDVGNDFWQ